MRKLAIIFLLFSLALPVAALAGDEKEGPGNIIIEGNEVIAETELLAVIDLKPGSRITKALARRVQRRLAGFYHGRGYTIATIWAKAHRGRLYVSIDEGKLEKVLIRGRGSASTFLMKIMFDLPGNVYNQEKVGEEVNRLRERFHLKDISVKLVKTPVVKEAAFKFQLSDIRLELTDIDLSELFPEEVATYELHIIIEPKKGSGAGVGAYTSPAFGFVPVISYTERGPFFESGQDRLKLKLESGYNLRKSLNDGDYHFLFTHALGGLRYDFPALWEVWRFYFDNHIAASSFQRRDLPLDEYWQFVSQSSANMGFDFFKGFSLHAGGGSEYKSIFSIMEVQSKPFPVEPFDNPRWFVSLGLDWDVNPEVMRTDRHHLLSLEYRHYWLDVSDFHRLQGFYQNVFPFGYNDLFIRSKFLLTFGMTPFHDEQPLGCALMRTFFGGRYYVDMAGWFSGEFRLSLWKDVIKLSAYHDLAMFGDIEHDPQAADGRKAAEATTAAVANSFGPGFHVLILDFFQLDIYGCFGFALGHGFGANYYLQLIKAY